MLGISGSIAPGATFNPAKISDLAIWYDAKFLTQGGGIVTAIDDRSSNNTDPTINAGEEPTYTTSNASYNNRPTWTCVAGGGTKVIRIPNTHIITTNARTIVIVGQCKNANYALGTPNGLTNIAGGGGVGDRWQTTSDGFGTILVSTDGLADNPSVGIFVLNGGSSKIYVNSKTPTTGDSGALEDLTGQEIEVGNYGAPADALGQDGPTTQFLIYNKALSQSECEYLLNGFGRQAGITISA